MHQPCIRYWYQFPYKSPVTAQGIQFKVWKRGDRQAKCPCTLYLPAVPLDSNPETGLFDIGLNQLDDAGCVEVAVAIGVVDRKRGGRHRTKRRRCAG